MPRTARLLGDGGFFHVVNRGNDRRVVFHSRLDYLVFLGFLKEAKARFPIAVLAFCLMPNHFHLIVHVRDPEHLTAFMRWATGCYSRYHHENHGTSGHLWQGRFKSHPIEREGYLITAVRYVEGNPKRAGLVAANTEWEWSSLGDHLARSYLGLTDPSPFHLAGDWLEFGEMPLTEKEFEIMGKNKRDSPSSLRSGDSP